MMSPASEKEAFGAFLLRLRAMGGVPANVVSAFEATPRAPFLDGPCRDFAWINRMAPVECGEAIEGVDVQAQIIGALGIEPNNRVLEIGSGTGYTAAVMSRLASRVITLDRYKTLVERARQRLDQLGIDNVVVQQADGSAGLPDEGSFDRIVVWAAFDAYPRIFVDQLSSAGVMVAPIGPDEGLQQLVRLTKVGSRFHREDIGEVRFQPLLKGCALVL